MPDRGLDARKAALLENLSAVRARIAAAERRFGRPAGSVTLIAVSKGFAAGDIASLTEAGHHRFGESYLNEALPKIEALTRQKVEWHFIGPIQSNKTRAIAGHFAWVHGVDRMKIAERLSAQHPPSAPPLQVCVQVNVSGEPGKSGVTPEEAPALVRYLCTLPHLSVRGLMTIPAPAVDFADQYQAFRRLVEVRDDIQRQGIMLDTLSMGMSGDLEAAIAAGSTCVRVGTAIFGDRNPSPAA